MKGLLIVIGSVLVSFVLLAFVRSGKKSTSVFPAGTSIYDFTMKTLDGRELSLSQFKGKKMLLVNVASECGFTPQYKGLQSLHEKYGDKLVIIGFPANNFGQQEPGSSEQIQSFCSKNYGVTFQMMEKINVKGKDTHPLYQWLRNKEENGSCEEAPGWNFCKYLISEDGKVIKFFKSKVDPMSEEITSLL